MRRISHNRLDLPPCRLEERAGTSPYGRRSYTSEKKACPRQDSAERHGNPLVEVHQEFAHVTSFSKEAGERGCQAETELDSCRETNTDTPRLSVTRKHDDGESDPSSTPLMASLNVVLQWFNSHMINMLRNDAEPALSMTIDQIQS